MRRVHDDHPAWAHLGGAAVTEADLPLPVSGGARGATQDAKEANTEFTKWVDKKEAGGGGAAV